jgi:hypothetical protein
LADASQNKQTKNIKREEGKGEKGDSRGERRK